MNSIATLNPGSRRRWRRRCATDVARNGKTTETRRCSLELKARKCWFLAGVLYDAEDRGEGRPKVKGEKRCVVVTNSSREPRTEAWSDENQGGWRRRSAGEEGGDDSCESRRAWTFKNGEDGEKRWEDTVEDTPAATRKAAAAAQREMGLSPPCVEWGEKDGMEGVD